MISKDRILDQLEITKEFIRKGDFNTAFERLREIVTVESSFFKQYDINELDLAISRYNTLEKYWIQGKIEDAFWEVTLNKITLALFQLIEMYIEKLKLVLTDSEVFTESIRVKIEFTLSENYQYFNLLKKDKIVKKLNEVLQISDNELELVVVRKGSVLITLQVIRSKLKQLISLVGSGVILKRCRKIKIEPNLEQEYIELFHEAFGHSMNQLSFSGLSFGVLMKPFSDFTKTVFRYSYFRYLFSIDLSFINNLFNPRLGDPLYYDLRYSRFRECSMFGYKVVSSNLRFSDFTNCNIGSKTCFSCSNLKGANFSNASIQSAYFISTSLESTLIHNTRIQDTSFVEVVLQNAEVRDCLISKCMFKRVDLRGVSLNNTKFIDVKFKNSIAYKFQKEELIEAGADIDGITFHSRNDLDSAEEYVWKREKL